MITYLDSLPDWLFDISTIMKAMENKGGNTQNVSATANNATPQYMYFLKLILDALYNRPDVQG